MKILITGISGFVGYHFIEFLKSNNIDADVFGVDMAETVDVDYPRFQYNSLNLLDFNATYDVIRDFAPTHILHLASASSVAQSWQNPVNTFNNNTNIFLNIAESVRQLKLNTRILSIGSSEEYGTHAKSEMPLCETCTLVPSSPYAVARVSQELLSKLYVDQYGVDIVMTRSFNHIGPRQRDVFVIPSFVKQLKSINENKQSVMLVGNIDVVRDFLDVRDVVHAYYLLLRQGRRGEIYNVCSGVGVSLNDVIGIISEKLGISPKIQIDDARVRPDDNPVIVGDNSKIVREMGWKPKYSIQETLYDMLKQG